MEKNLAVRNLNKLSQKEGKVRKILKGKTLNFRYLADTGSFFIEIPVKNFPFFTFSKFCKKKITLFLLNC